MGEQQMPVGVSRAFMIFGNEAPAHAAAWMDATRALADASVPDEKTAEIAYVAVLAALGMESGIPFHVKVAKAAGDSREEVISAILLGLQPAGHGVISSLPTVWQVFDAA